MPLGMCVNWLWEASKFSRLCGCAHVHVYICVCVCGHASISYHIMRRFHVVRVHCRCDMYGSIAEAQLGVCIHP